MKQILISVAVCAALLSSSTLVYAQDQAESEQRTSKAGKIGCAVGGVLGGLLGTKLLKDNKAVGGIAGGALGCGAGNVVGKKWSKARQLKEFQEAQVQAEAAGMQTKVAVVSSTEKSGAVSNELGSMEIAYNSDDMKAVSAQTGKVFDKIAAISQKAKNQLTFTFSGKVACEVPYVELGKRNAYAGQGVQHITHLNCGAGDSKLVITPIADIH